jgi:phosphatidate cytidylyltransferase
VANERDGDDLFEDLDKFFAPIKDVDWDEPEAPAEREAAEEHVAVHTEQPEPVPATSVEGEPPARVEAPDDDDAWLDTGVIEVDDLLSEEEPDRGIVVEESVEAIAAPAGDDLPTEAYDFAEVVEVSDQDVPEAGSADGQPDLFAQSEVVEAEPVVAVFEDVETAEVGPTDEDLAAAAEHFAGSVREEAEVDVVPLEGDEVDEVASDDVGSVAIGADLLSDLGADEVEDELLSDLQDDEGAPRTVVVGSEGFGGPSWQEPTSVEVGADSERRGIGGDRDVPAAFLTGLVLAAIALGALLIGPAAFAVVAALVILVAQGELFGVFTKAHRQPATAVGLVSGALMTAAAYLRGEDAVLAMFALGSVAVFLWFMAEQASHRKDVIGNIGLTLLDMAWIPLLGSYLIMLLDEPDGRALVVAVIGLTFLFDSAAFLVGSFWGGSFVQRPLAPSVSPKKSVEGLVFATLATVVVSVAIVTSMVAPFEGKQLEAALLGLVVSAAATFGDLAESLVKRDVGIKDMGSILPGHGGLLDRIDSLLFVAPAAFLVIRIVL